MTISSGMEGFVQATIKMKSRRSSCLVEPLLILLGTETEKNRQTNMILRMINVHTFILTWLMCHLEATLCVILRSAYLTTTKLTFCSSRIWFCVVCTSSSDKRNERKCIKHLIFHLSNTLHMPALCAGLEKIILSIIVNIDDYFTSQVIFYVQSGGSHLSVSANAYNDDHKEQDEAHDSTADGNIKPDVHWSFLCETFYGQQKCYTLYLFYMYHSFPLSFTSLTNL